ETCRIVRMAHADMAERIHHALVREDAVGGRQLVDRLGQLVGHDGTLRWRPPTSPVSSPQWAEGDAVAMSVRTPSPPRGAEMAWVRWGTRQSVPTGSGMV